MLDCHEEGRAARLLCWFVLPVSAARHLGSPLHSSCAKNAVQAKNSAAGLEPFSHGLHASPNLLSSLLQLRTSPSTMHNHTISAPSHQKVQNSYFYQIQLVQARRAVQLARAKWDELHDPQTRGSAAAWPTRSQDTLQNWRAINDGMIIACAYQLAP